jgi:hypothetical protein
MAVSRNQLLDVFRSMPYKVGDNIYVFESAAVYSAAGKKYPFPLPISDRIMTDLTTSISKVQHGLFTHGNCISISFNPDEPVTIGLVPDVIRVDLYTRKYPISYPPIFREVLYGEIYNGESAKKVYVMSQEERLDTVVKVEYRTKEGKKNAIPALNDHFLEFVKEQEDTCNIKNVTQNQNPTTVIINLTIPAIYRTLEITSLTFTGRTIPSAARTPRVDTATQTEELQVLQPVPDERVVHQPVPDERVVHQAVPDEREVLQPAPKRMRVSHPRTVFTYGDNAAVQLVLGDAPSFIFHGQTYPLIEARLTSGPKDRPTILKIFQLNDPELERIVGSLKQFRHSASSGKVYYVLDQNEKGLIGVPGVERLELPYHCPASIPAGAGGLP